MGTLSITINSVAVPIHEPSGVIIDDTAQQTTQCSFAVYDATGLTLQQKQQVSISESDLGVLYTGYIDTYETTIYQPTTNKLWIIRCADGHWLVDKRVYTGPEMSGRMAGDIVGALHQSYLVSEGIQAIYTIDHDYNATTFGTGTLAGVSALANGLELSKAGSTYTKTEKTTADWNTGTRSKCGGNANALMPDAYQGVKMTGQAMSQAISTNLFTYYKIWNGSVGVASGDYLEYYIWISSTSPKIVGGVDCICSDGTTVRDNPNVDEYQIASHPNSDLTGYANDQWYYRKINLGTQIQGKTFTSCVLVLEGDDPGIYTFYVHDICLKNSGGSVKAWFNQSGYGLNTTQQLSTSGYQNVKVTSIWLYADGATRTSPAYSLTGVGMAGNSLISWQGWEPLQTTSGYGSYPHQLVVETSADGGASWQECTNHGVIPSVIPGMNCSGRSIKIRQTINIGGPDPTLASYFYNCTITVQPTYNVSKTDVYHGDVAGSMSDGTLSAVLNNSNGIELDGYYYDWQDRGLSGTTLYYSGGIAAAQSNYYRTLQLRGESGQDTHVRLDNIGSHTNFTVEADIQLTQASGSGAGILYRTTYWYNNNNTFGYCAYISDTQVVLGHGSNSGTITWTGVALVNKAFTVGSWYRLKVVVNGTSHQVYVDDVLYINATDSWFTGAGQLGLRFWNTSGSRSSNYFGAFGLQDNSTGYRTAPTVSISACGTVLNSFIDWEADVPDNSTIDVQVSTNGGGAWTSCTRGGQIPGATPGTNVAGKSLLVRATLVANNSNVTPTLKGIGWEVIGGFSVSGSKTSVATSVGAIGHAGSTSMSWVADTPTGTTLTVQTSTNGSSWNTVAANGDPVAGISSMPNPTDDDYEADHSANYTSTYISGGAVAAYTWNTANSRLNIVGGTNALYVWNSTTTKDQVLDIITSQINQGGIIARYTDANNFYRLVIYDDASTVVGSRNTLAVIRRVAGVETQVGSTVTGLNFHRGKFYKFTFSLIGQVLTVLMDGVQVFTNTDSSGISASGKAGLYNNAGTAYYQSMRMQPQGQDLTGLNVYYKMILTTTDPLATPHVYDATLSVRSANILSGALMPSTNMAYKKLKAILDDVAKKSNYWWDIKNNNLLFLSKTAQLAPWPLSSIPNASNANDILASSVPKLTGTSPMYRNRQYITNCYDVVDIVEQKRGDGITQSWALTGEVLAMGSVTVSTQQRDVGQQDVDTGMEFYWTFGGTTFNQDKTFTPLADGEVATITYIGMIPYIAMAESTAQQTTLAALDGSTGIVEESEDGNGIDKATGDLLASARITQYAILSRNWTFSTRRPGLTTGQMLSVFVAEYGLNDADFFINSIKTTIHIKSDSTTLIYYDVTCTEGPPLGSWSRMFVLN